ncbi:class I SAM-dependent methyltransferase [Bradyrhizobium japonicum]|uniref:class I SAM-dependent methyltransferase n=1 Tax=Bradyrhizobium japonicum TaxID=375 RepID=UPI000675DD18|nr:class I SAM-dependent methyltransferase [Bradyrhizobium japonicum]
MPLDHLQSCKEIVRHVLFRLGADEIINVARRLRGRDTSHMREAQLDKVFSEIYVNGVWIESAEQASLSGLGSSRLATDPLTRQLSEFLRDVECTGLVDIGCGDFNWMSRVAGDFDYLGIDIVPSLIASHNEVYAHARRRFSCMDATKQPLERWGDVAICREVLFHLSFKNALALLRNIRSANFRYVLLTSDSSMWFNSDIRDGDFRRINLMRSPFGLPAPKLQLRDDGVSGGRILAVWDAGALNSLPNIE